jgi:hypothetical protein
LAWFFGGTALSLALCLVGLIWALGATGLSGELVRRLPAVVMGRSAGASGVASAPLSTAVPTSSAVAAGSATPATTGTPAPAGAAPTQPAPSAAQGPVKRARVGEIVESGPWKLLINGVATTQTNGGGRRVTVDFSVKNDGDQAATLEIPSTVPQNARPRTASLEGDETPALQPIQLTGPPALQLRLYDRAERAYGGGFVAANGQSSGAYTFESAPRDAIRLTYGFDLPPSSADPLTLEAQFGVDAGGARARIGLDERAESAATLLSSDAPKSAAKDERLTIGNTWAITARSVQVAEPGGDGQRTVTVKVKVENLADRSLLLGASQDDPTGGNRDFYAVDAAGQLAYSSSDTMPKTTIPAGQSRDVDVTLKAGRDFATSGPYRFSVVVDPRRDRYGVFKLP